MNPNNEKQGDGEEKKDEKNNENNFKFNNNQSMGDVTKFRDNNELIGQRKFKISSRLTPETMVVGAQSFTSLKADHRQDIKGGFSFSR